ncbi:MAG: hypothetical protein MZV64_18915 [Ignavibacteriales bacterium]|nr:hypothetical protein [Ignavibacteriales bacterium]
MPQTRQTCDLTAPSGTPCKHQLCRRTYSGDHRRLVSRSGGRHGGGGCLVRGCQPGRQVTL